jgi:methylase of polypeptide subunit release factors
VRWGVRVRRDLGDFQTPPELAAAVLECLGPVGERWPRVLEPTCGRGNFIAGLLAQRNPPREIQAIEIQDGHCALAREISESDANPRGVRVRIHQGDFFGLDLNRDLDWQQDGPLLVVGNPPWVTSAELGRLGARVRPPKRRIDGLDGFAALTGASNFDVAEAVWLKLIRELALLAPTIALLCKASVARRILQRAHRSRLPIATASIRRLDAARWFGAAVDACLFQVVLGDPERLRQVPVYENLTQTHPESMMSFARGWLIADGEAYSSSSCADGACPLAWRQGVKHDAASVMELIREPSTGLLRNRTGEILDVEPRFVYPLIKGSDLGRDPGASPERAVLVTQQRIGDNTVPLAGLAPRLWSYLEAHSASFTKRGSSIYRGGPPFAMFGIGPYSFSPFKVATGGLHKEPRFRALGPKGGKPVMLDDTCYFVPASSALEAAVLAALCDDPITLAFLRSASFKSAKRPITKAILQRVDLTVILARTDRRALRARARDIQKRELGVVAGNGISDAIERMEREFARSMSQPPRNSSSSVGIAEEDSPLEVS